MSLEIFSALAVVVIMIISFRLIAKFIYKSDTTDISDKTITISIIDSHQLFRKGIGMALSHQGFQILSEASEGKEMIDFVTAHGKPDIAIVSTNLKGMNAIETVKWLKNNQPGTRILVIYLDPLQEHPDKLIEAGAHGFISKTAAPEEIKAALIAVLKNGIYKPQRTYAYRALNSF